MKVNDFTLGSDEKKEFATSKLHELYRFCDIAALCFDIIMDCADAACPAAAVNVPMDDRPMTPTVNYSSQSQALPRPSPERQRDHRGI